MNNAYIPAGGFISIFNNHQFKVSDDYDIIYTNKGSNPGYINFASNSNWQDANENSYIDGFVRVLHDDFFTFPVGDLGFYSPISITGGAGTSVAYFFEDVSNNSLVTEVSEVRNNSNFKVIPSSTEYWVIKGDKPVNLILHWNEDSNLKSIASELEEIELLGWNGTNWEIIESNVSKFALDLKSSNRLNSSQKSNLERGSIETSLIVPNDYSIITFGSSKEKKVEIPSSDLNSFVSQNNEEIELTIFPNPINNLNNIKIDYKLTNLESKAYVVVFDNSGKLLMKDELNDLNGIYDLKYNEQTNQMYNIGIITENGSKKIGSVLVGRR